MPKTKGTTGNTFAALALPVLDTSDKDEIGQLRLRENIKSANEALAAANAEKSTFDKAKKTTEKHKEAILANADAQAKAIMQAARKQIEEINKKTQEEVDNLRSEDVGEERKIHNKVRVLEAQVNFLQAQLEALSPPPCLLPLYAMSWHQLNPHRRPCIRRVQRHKLRNQLRNQLHKTRSWLDGIDSSIWCVLRLSLHAGKALHSKRGFIGTI